MLPYITEPTSFATGSAPHPYSSPPRRMGPREMSHKSGSSSLGSQGSNKLTDMELGYTQPPLRSQVSLAAAAPAPDNGVRNDLTAAAGEYLGTVSGLCFLWLDF